MKSGFGFLYRVGFISTAIIILASVVSCLPVPLSDPAQSRIDSKLTGYWLKEQTNPDEVIVLLIAPFDKNAYLIHAVGYDKKDDSARKDHMVFKGWLTELKGQRFLVMESDDQLAGSVGTTVDETYPTYKLEIKGDRIVARLVRDNYGPLKNVKTAKELAGIITDNLDNPAIYLDAEHWRRLNAKQDKTLIEESMK